MDQDKPDEQPNDQRQPQIDWSEVLFNISGFDSCLEEGQQRFSRYSEASVLNMSFRDNHSDYIAFLVKHRASGASGIYCGRSLYPRNALDGLIRVANDAFCHGVMKNLITDTRIANNHSFLTSH